MSYVSEAYYDPVTGDLLVEDVHVYQEANDDSSKWQRHEARKVLVEKDGAPVWTGANGDGSGDGGGDGGSEGTGGSLPPLWETTWGRVLIGVGAGAVAAVFLVALAKRLRSDRPLITP
ncbi:MAG: hypothetical protein Kow0069_21070 [Promethearchaeota archaeon]